MVDKIELSGALIAELYSSSLVGSPETKKAKPQDTKLLRESGLAEHTLLNFFGANRKNITLLVENPGIEISASDLKFLLNLLKACKLSEDDVAILPYQSTSLSIQQIKEELLPSELLLFGVNPVNIGIPLNFPQFKLQSYDKTTYLYAPSLTQINQDTEAGKLLKSKLWVCLKQLFQL